MIVKFLLEKLASRDYKVNAREWKDILKEKENVNEERVEKTLKETPAFNFLEIINFAIYFNDLRKEDIGDKSVEELFMEWQNKLKK